MAILSDIERGKFGARFYRVKCDRCNQGRRSNNHSATSVWRMNHSYRCGRFPDEIVSWTPNKK